MTGLVRSLATPRSYKPGATCIVNSQVPEQPNCRLVTPSNTTNDCRDLGQVYLAASWESARLKFLQDSSFVRLLVRSRERFIFK